jgi:hypothetical protein
LLPRQRRGRRSADGQRFAAQIGIISLLDRRIKRVHVDMQIFRIRVELTSCMAASSIAISSAY